MTGHRHEPFDGERTDMPPEEKKDPAHKHLWIAVGVTMTVITGFWLVLFPSQFRDKLSPADDGRLQSPRIDEYREMMRTSLEGIRGQLDDASLIVEEEQEAPAPQEDTPSYDEEIQHLQERLETETQR